MRKTFATKCPVCGLPSKEADCKRYIKRKGMSETFFRLTRVLKRCSNCKITFSVLRSKVILNQIWNYYFPQTHYVKRKQRLLPAPETTSLELRPANLPRIEVQQEIVPKPTHAMIPADELLPYAQEEKPNFGFQVSFNMSESENIGKQVKRKLSKSIEMISNAIDSLNQVEGIKSWNLSYDNKKKLEARQHKTSQDD